MILKESKINSTFKNFLNNEVKSNLNNILIGLEMELQTNTKEQEDIFFPLVEDDYDNEQEEIELTMFVLKDEISINNIGGGLQDNIIGFIEQQYGGEIYDDEDDIEDDYRDFEIVSEFSYSTDDSWEQVIHLKIIKSFKSGNYYLVEIKRDDYRGETDYQIYGLNEDQKNRFTKQMDVNIDEWSDAGNTDMKYKIMSLFYKDGLWKPYENPYPNEDLDNVMIDHYFNASDQLKEYFELFGIDIDYNYRGDTQIDYFAIEPDASLHPNPPYYTTFELKTPFPFTLNDQLKFFKQFLDNERKKDYGLEPNESCGLHVNVSISNQKRLPHLNFIILYELFNENKYKVNTRMTGYKETVKSIENFDVHYQKQVKNRIKKRFLNLIDKLGIDINDTETLLRRSGELLYQSVEEDEDSDNKFRSFVTKDDRIEFRIMGYDYLKPLTMKYILEMQGIYYQQATEPQELKKQCEHKFIKRILKEIPKNKKNVDKKKKKMDFLENQISILSELMEKIEKDDLVFDGKKVQIDSNEVQTVVWDIKRQILYHYNKLFNDNVTLYIDKDWYKSKEQLLERINRIKLFLEKQKIKNKYGSEEQVKERLNKMKEKQKNKVNNEDIKKVLDV